MTIWAIIPVKQLEESKRRLQHLLSAGERAELIRGFLDHLILVLGSTPSIDRILLVTADPDVVTLAREHGADVLIEATSTGLNSAVEMGRMMAVADGAATVLVLPADLPYARVEDIEQMLRPLVNGRWPLIAICGDEWEDGTNALLLSPPLGFTFQYGPGSFRAHLNEARRRGMATCVINAPGLRFDLDTESDWLAYNGYLVQLADE